MARGWNACALLVFAASALLTVSADLLTTDQIQGMIDSNCLYTSNPPAGAPVGTSHGLDHAGCVSCINGFTTPSSTGADGAKVEACFNVCQDPQNQLPGLTTANAAQCVDCLAAANRDICSVCLSLPSTAATDCMAYWINHDDITVTDTNAKAAYVWAVGECFMYPTANNVRANCLSCLEGYAPATDDAQYFGKCIDAQQQASYIAQGEWDKVNGIYAMCGAAAYTGTANTGISSSECYTCMLAVQDAFKDQVQDPILGPQLQRKPYGCAQYCMTEATPLAPSKDSTYKDRCTECLAATTPADAWACGNCASITSVDNGKVDCFDCIADDPYTGHTSNFNWACAECSKIADAQLRTLCMQCIRSQPEYGAKPTDPTDTTSDAYKKYLAFIEHTEANICSCVDLTYHAGNTNIHPGAVTIAANRTLDAFELKCFMPQYTYDAAGALVTPSIPWGDIILPYYGADGSIYKGNDATGALEPCPGCTVDGGPNPAYGGINYAPTTACVECVDSTYRSSAPQFPKQYACSEYCQDPATILPTYTADLPSAFGGTGAVVSEGQDCSSCVQDARVLDPSDCKACIQATNHFTGDFRALRRKQCFALVQSPRVGPAAPATPPSGKRSLLQTTTPSVWPAYAWAASQCVQFTNDIAYGYCASCLTTGCEDPCLCVDKSRNATGTYAPPATCAVQPPPPQGTPCNPQYLWFWTWVNRYCDEDCFTANYDLPSPSDANYVNWKSRTVSEFDYQIQERTRPNLQNCQHPVGGAIGGLPGNLACGFRQIFPTLNGNAPPRHVDSGIHAFTVNSEPIADPSNGVYYDVVGIRIDVSLVQFTPNSQCIADPNNGGECQFFLVVSNAEATGGSGGSDNGNADPSVKNYSPVVIAWDDSQAATTIGGNDVSGFQNSNGVYQAYNSIAIELDDCRNNLLYTSITPPPANTAMWTGDARNLGNNNVWRMFQVLSPTTPTLPIYHDKK